jgi:CubicO group peptidase (beta-lactamase class C family)
MFEAIHREALLEEIGAHSVYSDLGFILLGEVLERLSGCDWVALWHKEICPAVGITGLFYMTENGRSDGVTTATNQFAATEQDEWRGRVLRGEVHDENAAVMGGVSSHAGLFGTAESVASLAALWLTAARGDAGPLSMAREFLVRQNIAKDSSWGLGWDTPSSGPTGPSSSGQYLSPVSFGHLGYAGTSLWMDPEQDLMVVLLTNRVHPTRKNNLLRQFRPELHDTIFKSVSGQG